MTRWRLNHHSFAIAVLACFPGLACESSLKVKTNEEKAAPGTGVENPSQPSPDQACIDPPLESVNAGSSWIGCSGSLLTGTGTSSTRCSGESTQNCLVGTEHIAIAATDLSSPLISSTETLLGVAGSGAPPCSSDGQTGCTATTSLPSAAANTSPDAANIRAGLVLNGVQGTMKYCKSSADIAFADASSFPTNLPFENLRSLSLTPDSSSDSFSATNFIFESGVPVRLTATTMPVGLIAGTTYFTIFINSTSFKLADSYANATASTPLPVDFSTNGAGVKMYGKGDGLATIHDTIDRGNFQSGGGSIGRLGPDSPYGANFHCPSSNWELTAPSPDGVTIVPGNSTHCDEASDDCMMRDKLTGLIWSETINATTLTWAHRVRACRNLNSGNMSGWRLPTYKELAQAYVNGIAITAQYPFFNSWGGKWFGTATATSLTANTAHSIGIYLDNFWAGTTNGSAKTGTTDRIFCVRQGPAGNL